MENGMVVWADLVVFSPKESIPPDFKKYVIDGTSEDMGYGEGQLSGHFTVDTICNSMEEEGWRMIATIQVTEDWIELYFER